MQKTKQTVARLLDYQHFQPSKKLADVIDGTITAYGQNRVLTDDEADVWAAGDIDAMRTEQRQEQDDA